MFDLYFKCHGLEFDPWYLIQILKFLSIIWVLNILFLPSLVMIARLKRAYPLILRITNTSK